MSGIETDEMVEVCTRHVGLAAYIQMKGAKLLHVKNKFFTFLSERTLDEWRVEYSNSCCMKHDNAVCELRRFVQKPSE